MVAFLGSQVVLSPVVSGCLLLLLLLPLLAPPLLVYGMQHAVCPVRVISPTVWGLRWCHLFFLVFNFGFLLCFWLLTFWFCWLLLGSAGFWFPLASADFCLFFFLLLWLLALGVVVVVFVGLLWLLLLLLLSEPWKERMEKQENGATSRKLGETFRNSRNMK